MRSLVALLALTALVACGSTSAKSTSTTGGADGGASCDGGACGSGSTGGTRQSCNTDKDCTLGRCKVGAGGKKYCQVECSVDADCTEAGSMCNQSKGICVPRPATTGSTGTTSTNLGTTGPTSGTSGSTGVAVTSTTSGTSGTSGTTSTTTTTSSGPTGTTGTTGTTSTAATTGTTGTSATTTTGTTGTTTTSGTTGTAACTVGSCPSGQVCDFNSGSCHAPTGSGALGATCSTSADCQSGYCKGFTGGSRCVQACAASNECPSSFVCLYYGASGVCLDQNFAFGGSFTVGGQGVDQSCNPSNTTNSDCHSLYYCNSSISSCTDFCGKDAECQVTSEAQSDGWICISSGASANPSNPFCWYDQGANSGATCSTDSDCGDVSGGCDTSTGYCNVGNSCQSDSQCRHNLCATFKTSPSSTKTYCSMPCCSYYDCPGATTCLPELGGGESVYRACVDFPSGSSGIPGDACDPHNPSTCYSGICRTNEPANPNSTNGFCSTTCCTDADCSFWDSSGNSVCRLVDSGLTKSDGTAAGTMGVCVRQ